MKRGYKRVPCPSYLTWGGIREWPGLARILQEGVGLYRRQRHVANAWGRKIETILLEGVGLFLCSDAREGKVGAWDVVGRRMIILMRL